VCQGAWERSCGHEDRLARLCCDHHPDYKYIGSPPKACVSVAINNQDEIAREKQPKKKKKNNDDKDGSSKVKDPPEVVGVNALDDEGDSRLKDPLALFGVNAQDEQGGERILKDYQMVGMDAHVKYSMAPPMDYVISPPLADVIGNQWNGSRKKIVFGGIPYTCNKDIGDNTKKGNAITKYYCCGMVLFNGEGER
jgi:hypothetical protein